MRLEISRGIARTQNCADALKNLQAESSAKDAELSRKNEALGLVIEAYEGDDPVGKPTWVKACIAALHPDEGWLAREVEKATEPLNAAIAYLMDTDTFDLTNAPKLVVEWMAKVRAWLAARDERVRREWEAKAWEDAGNVAEGTVDQDKGFGGKDPAFWKACEHLAGLFHTHAKVLRSKPATPAPKPDQEETR